MSLKQTLMVVAMVMTGVACCVGVGLGADGAPNTPAYQRPKPSALPQPPIGVTAFRDIPYAGTGEACHLLDIYVPDNADKPLPLLVWIYGGAWAMFDKASAAGGPALPASAQGYVVADIDYSHSQEAIFPAQIYDVKAAIRFLRAHARQYHIDPNRIGVWGESSGGHLAALLGTSGHVAELEGKVGNCLDQSSAVQAVVCYCTPSNFPLLFKFPTDSARGPVTGLLGGWGDAVMDLAVKASPITYVSKDDPPFLLIHGDKDITIPLSQSESFAKALQEKGVDVTFTPIPGANHFVRNSNTNKIAMAFFDKYLKPGK